MQPFNYIISAMLLFCAQRFLSTKQFSCQRDLLEVGNREIKTAKCSALNKIAKFSSANFSRYTVVFHAHSRLLPCSNENFVCENAIHSASILHCVWYRLKLLFSTFLACNCILAHIGQEVPFSPNSLFPFGSIREIPLPVTVVVRIQSSCIYSTMQLHVRLHLHISFNYTVHTLDSYPHYRTLECLSFQLIQIIIRAF